jgi:hypothetical protein
MYFYHEGYHDAYYTGAALEELRGRDRCDDDSTYEPIRTPAVLNWLAIMVVAFGIISTIIHALS